MHHTSMQFQIFDAIHTFSSKHLQHLHQYVDIFSIHMLQVHCLTSPNILLHKGAYTANIWYYLHTPHRLLIGSSGTFGYFLISFPQHSRCIGMHLQIFLLYNNAHRHTTPAFIFPHQSSLLVCTFWSLAFTSDQSLSTAIPCLHSPLIGTYLFLIHFLFISFSFHISLTFFLFLSCFMFQIFVFLFQSFIFLFLNISKYLYTHVLVVAQ